VKNIEQIAISNQGLIYTERGTGEQIDWRVGGGGVKL
jgi:hypothetical protein